MLNVSRRITKIKILKSFKIRQDRSGPWSGLWIRDRLWTSINDCRPPFLLPPPACLSLYYENITHTHRDVCVCVCWDYRPSVRQKTVCGQWWRRRGRQCLRQSGTTTTNYQNQYYTFYTNYKPQCRLPTFNVSLFILIMFGPDPVWRQMCLVNLTLINRTLISIWVLTAKNKKNIELIVLPF